MTTTRRARPAHARGQALVLLSLTMLLVTLMVLMTLGISSRVKEKMEVQQVADAASYSTAVATSRSMNTIALLNRVHVATMVALSANQSLISWVGLYRGALNQYQLTGGIVTAAVCAIVPYCTASCTQMNTLMQSISDAKNDVDGDWNDPDSEAGEQSRKFQKSVTSVQKVTLESLRDDIVKDQKLAKKIISIAAEGDPHSEWTVESRGDAVTVGEHKWFEDSADQSKPKDDDALFLVPRRETRELAVEAAHGSRGSEWVTQRSMLANQLIALKLSTELNKVVVGLTARGEGWFGNEATSGEAGNDYGTSPRAAVAQDSASYSMIAPALPCVPILPAVVTASVFSDDKTESNNDEHKWTLSGEDDDEPPTERHTMGSCSACPGVWTGFIDLNPAQVKQERRWETLYGQPKVMSALERDYSKRTEPDPWALNFKFGLTGKEKQFDNQGLKADGANISRQYAVSTAISYYHRPGGHWEEPPNFFNPFWRATLVSPGVDNNGHPNPQGSRASGATGGDGDDLPKLLNGLPNGSVGADVVKALADAGFQGWQ